MKSKFFQHHQTSLFSLSGRRYSIAVRRTTSEKGTNWQMISQMSIILESEVGGRPSILLMKMVVITNIVVKFTLKAASKKKGLKKLVAKEIIVKSMVGRKVFNNSLLGFLFNFTFR